MLIMQTVLNINRLNKPTHSTAGISSQPSRLLAIRKQASRLGNVF
ncbi:hypothetical protein [Kangiella spongicola]|nr:hypothetical protein [Kangiella spongicola]